MTQSGSFVSRTDINVHSQQQKLYCEQIVKNFRFCRQEVFEWTTNYEPSTFGIRTFCEYSARPCIIHPSIESIPTNLWALSIHLAWIPAGSTRNGIMIFINTDAFHSAMPEGSSCYSKRQFGVLDLEKNSFFRYKPIRLLTIQPSWLCSNAS